MYTRPTSRFFDIVSIILSYLALIPPVALLDARRLFEETDYQELVVGDSRWGKVLEYISTSRYLSHLALYPPLLITAFIVACTISFHYNTLRVLSAHRGKLLSSGKFTVCLIGFCVVGGILLTADVVDYVLLIVPLAVAVSLIIMLAVGYKRGDEDKANKEEENLEKGGG